MKNKDYALLGGEDVALNASYIALACLNIINYIIDSRLIDI